MTRKSEKYYLFIFKDRPYEMPWGMRGRDFDDFGPPAGFGNGGGGGGFGNGVGNGGGFGMSAFKFKN